jgi:hypothetical protein
VLDPENIFMTYKNDFLNNIQETKNINKINFVLMNVLLKKNNVNEMEKNVIAKYFHNYIHGVLRSDTGESRFNELEKIYNLIINKND